VARAAAWIAALIYGANPNLLYLQATAMTEPLYLALFIWLAVYFADFLRLSSRDARMYRRPLYRCALCLAGAELTRYDGWFLASVIGLFVLFQLRQRWNDRAFRGLALKFLVCIAVAPLLWLAYNAAVYKNALEFANGPYSAKAIEQRTAAPGYPAHPGAGNVVTAASFFLKSAQLNMAEGNWGRIWILIAFAGSWVGIRTHARNVILLLWVPVAFYGLSIAYSGVPLFVPTWWPFTWYNLRYGLQLLPLFAVTAAWVTCAAIESAAPGGAVEKAALAPSLRRWPDMHLLLRGSWVVVLVIAALSYGFIWRAQSLCFKEAWVNSRTKLALESSVAQVVALLPHDSRYLMYVGEHVGVFQQAGIPLRQVINEGNHRPWKKPADPDGLWERALANPSRYVDFVIAYDGDAVDQAVNRADLNLEKEMHTLGQARVKIYTVRPGLNQSR
jgi:hypothetical protein